MARILSAMGNVAEAPFNLGTGIAAGQDEFDGVGLNRREPGLVEQDF